MSQLLIIGISICALLVLAMIADWLLADKVAWQDLVWRSTLMTMLMLPILVVSGTVLWPSGLVQIPVLAAQPVSQPNDSVTEKRTFRPGDRDFKVANNSLETFQPQPSVDQKTAQPLVDSKAIISGPKQVSSVNVKDTVVDAPMAPTGSKSFSFSWPAIVMAIWLLGSFVFLVRYIAGWWAIRIVTASTSKTEPRGWSRAIDRATKIAGLNSRITVRASNRIATPMLVGILRPLVLVPEFMLQFSHADARVRSALSHEAMHIRRSDPF
ncbi:MAG: M56 family metallopeptidase [Mariniblastus sp.]